ncbi:MAG: hypothetical protein CMB80_02805 [Flammeovirgaceae bacterium]|nr:hypothetical protein [Flammeovirgaceae bacterium]
MQLITKCTECKQLFVFEDTVLNIRMNYNSSDEQKTEPICPCCNENLKEDCMAVKLIPMATINVAKY